MRNIYNKEKQSFPYIYAYTWNPKNYKYLIINKCFQATLLYKKKKLKVSPRSIDNYFITCLKRPFFGYRSKKYQLWFFNKQKKQCLQLLHSTCYFTLCVQKKSFNVLQWKLKRWKDKQHLMHYYYNSTKLYDKILNNKYKNILCLYNIKQHYNKDCYYRFFHNKATNKMLTQKNLKVMFFYNFLKHSLQECKQIIVNNATGHRLTFCRLPFWLKKSKVLLQTSFCVYEKSIVKNYNFINFNTFKYKAPFYNNALGYVCFSYIYHKIKALPVINSNRYTNNKRKRQNKPKLHKDYVYNNKEVAYGNIIKFNNKPIMLQQQFKQQFKGVAWEQQKNYDTIQATPIKNSRIVPIYYNEQKNKTKLMYLSYCFQNYLKKNKQNFVFIFTSPDSYGSSATFAAHFNEAFYDRESWTRNYALKYYLKTLRFSTTNFKYIRQWPGANYKFVLPRLEQQMKVEENNNVNKQSIIIKRTALLKFLQILDGFYGLVSKNNNNKTLYKLTLLSNKNIALEQIFSIISWKKKQSLNKKQRKIAEGRHNIKNVVLQGSSLGLFKFNLKYSKKHCYGTLFSFNVLKKILNLSWKPFQSAPVVLYNNKTMAWKQLIKKLLTIKRPHFDTMFDIKKKNYYHNMLFQGYYVNNLPKIHFYKTINMSKKHLTTMRAFHLLCVWPSYSFDILGSSYSNDSGSFILPKYFQLLSNGSKFKKQNITIIACTNNLTTLDPALLRPGRFDTIIDFSKHSLRSKLSFNTNDSNDENSIRKTQLLVNNSKQQATLSNLSIIYENFVYHFMRGKIMEHNRIIGKDFIYVSIFVQYKYINEYLKKSSFCLDLSSLKAMISRKNIFRTLSFYVMFSKFWIIIQNLIIKCLKTLIFFSIMIMRRVKTWLIVSLQGKQEKHENKRKFIYDNVDEFIIKKFNNNEKPMFPGHAFNKNKGVAWEQYIYNLINKAVARRKNFNVFESCIIIAIGHHFIKNFVECIQVGYPQIPNLVFHRFKNYDNNFINYDYDTIISTFYNNEYNDKLKVINNFILQNFINNSKKKDYKKNVFLNNFLILQCLPTFKQLSNFSLLNKTVACGNNVNFHCTLKKSYSYAIKNSIGLCKSKTKVKCFLECYRRLLFINSSFISNENNNKTQRLLTKYNHIYNVKKKQVLHNSNKTEPLFSLLLLMLKKWTIFEKHSKFKYYLYPHYVNINNIIINQQFPGVGLFTFKQNKFNYTDHRLNENFAQKLYYRFITKHSDTQNFNVNSMSNFNENLKFLNDDNYKMCRFDSSIFILMFFNLFYNVFNVNKIVNNNIDKFLKTLINKKKNILALNTIKFLTPYKSIIFSHLLLSKDKAYNSKNLEILVYNKFKPCLYSYFY